MGQRLAAYLLLLAVSLPSLTWNLADHPAAWFDEGYKINAAWTLAEHGVYGTETVDGTIPFDPGISAGPVLILPVALAFELGGVGLVQGRIVAVLFALAAVLAFYEVCRFAYGGEVALLLTLALIAAGAHPQVGLIQLGRQVMGEVPGLACVLVGLRLWFASWTSGRRTLALLSGVFCAMALLAKLQIVAGLLPALAVAGAARRRAGRSDWIVSFTPLVVAIALTAAWRAVEYGLTPAAMVVQNSAMFRLVVETTILRPHRGRALGNSANIATAFMLLAIGLASLRLAWRRDGGDRAWATFVLVLFVGSCSLWYVAFSIAWLRYGFYGLVLATALLGGPLEDLLAALRNRFPSPHRRLQRGAVALLASAALVLNLAGAARAECTGAAEMAAYVRTQVPPDAVIESWDVELDALSGHWSYHHPHQRYLFLAARRYFLEPVNDGGDARDRFALDYDPLQSDPSFVISGPMSEWTRVYDRVLWTHFRLVATFGRYRLFERVR